MCQKHLSLASKVLYILTAIAFLSISRAVANYQSNGEDYQSVGTGYQSSEEGSTYQSVGRGYQSPEGGNYQSVGTGYQSSDEGSNQYVGREHQSSNGSIKQESARLDEQNKEADHKDKADAKTDDPFRDSGNKKDQAKKEVLPRSMDSRDANNTHSAKDYTSSNRENIDEANPLENQNQTNGKDSEEAIPAKKSASSSDNSGLPWGLVLILSLLFSVFFSAITEFVKRRKPAPKDPKANQDEEKPVNPPSVDQDDPDQNVVNALKGFEDRQVKDATDIKKALSEMMQGFGILQGSLDEKDKEIRRLRKGFDTEVFRRFLKRFISVDDGLNDEIKRCPENETGRKEGLNEIREILQDALYECGLEDFNPELGTKLRDAFGINENPKTIPAPNAEQELTIAEVCETGYLLRVPGRERGECIKPAKVIVYGKFEG